MSDDFTFDAADDVSSKGGNYLADEGTYHLVVDDIMIGKGPKGGTVNGFTVKAVCLAGTAKDCKGKLFDETLFKPDKSKGENSQAMAKKKITNFCIATNVMQPSKIGEKGVGVALADAVGAHLVIKLVHGQEKNAAGDYVTSSKFLQINYADIWHVDDPEVKDIPKDDNAIETMIQNKDHRHEPAWFAFKGKESGSKPADKQVETADSFSDL